MEKLGDVLNTPAETSSTVSKGSMPKIKGDVEFKDVSFRYNPGGNEIIKKMSFNIQAGMGVTSEIKTGKRKVIEYLLSPVMKYMNESMRER